MMLLTLIEVVSFIIFWLSLLTQVVLPLWNNTPLFPIFRKKTKVLQPEELPEPKPSSETKQAKAQLEYTNAIEKLKKRKHR